MEKILSILDDNYGSPLCGSFLSDPHFQPAPVSSLYYDILPIGFDVGIILGENQKTSANHFKSACFWVNDRPNHVYLLAKFCRENKMRMLNGDLILQNSTLINDKVMQTKFFQDASLPFIPISNTYQDNDMVAKRRNGSCGKQVELVPRGSQLPDDLYQKTTQKGWHIQKFIPYMHDYRVIVVGGKSIGVIERLPPDDDFRANISLGAKALAVNNRESSDVIDLAEDTAQKLGCDYVGVDILSYSSGLYVVEVNFFANFRGFESIHGIGHVTKHIKQYLWR